MVVTNVELHEALTPKLGKETARMLAEKLSGRAVTPELLREELDRLRTELRAEVELLIDRRCSRVEASLKGSMLLFFIPLWLGTWGAMLAFVLKA